MKIHFEQEIQSLNEKITQQASSVEKSVRSAILSLSERNAELAFFVIAGDDALDRNEVKIEEECLKVLALYQPVASDLRYVVTMLKVNTELERIGDLAVNIAERVMHLLPLINESDKIDVIVDSLNRSSITNIKSNKVQGDTSLSENDLKKSPLNSALTTNLERNWYSTMFYEVSCMLKKSLDSFLLRDAELAEEVIQNDGVIDDLHRNNLRQIKKMLQEHPKSTEILLDFMTISRNLERIADSCTNIGEDVIYQERGKIVRHFWKDEKEEEKIDYAE